MKWHPSRLGSFYFAFKNDSTKACDDNQKLAIQVSSSVTPETASPPVPQPPMPASSPSPSPTISSGSHGTIVSSTPPPMTSSGGIGGGDIVSSSPSYPWPSRPQEETSPSPSPMNAIFPSDGPMGAPRKGGSLPFINSNPAVPLPTGEVDSTTIHPATSSGNFRLQVTLPHG